MKNRILYLLFILTIPQICLAQEIRYPVLVFDSPKAAELPKNFRTTKDPFKKHFYRTPTREGFDNLNASASGQISESTLKKVLPKIGRPVYILDLRQESHGFLNGKPISWYAYRNFGNKDKSPSEIIETENSLLAGVRKERSISVHYIKEKINGGVTQTSQQQVKIETVENPKAFWQRQGLQFRRFFVRDHRRPSPKEVDRFMAFIKSLPANSWIHFHCRAGRGRSSTFLIMYDIMRNGKTVPLQEIIRRNHLVGSININAYAVTPRWKSKNTTRRRKFIRRFYAYVNDSKGYGKLSYSNWYEQVKSGKITILLNIYR